MKLFIGLGNPGTRYARNRHNVGFMAVARIAQAHGFGAWRSRFHGQAAEGQLGGEKCLLLKPGTYMNESGRAAGEAVRFHKLGLDDVIVFYDEIDLAPGKVRVKTGGGTAGHNGVRSLAAHIGPDFTRVRIGVGHPGNKAGVHNYVLKDFAKADADWLEPLLDAIAAAAPNLAEGKAANFMNELARRTQEPDTAKDRKPKPGKKAGAKAGTKPAEKAGAGAGAKAPARAAAQDAAADTGKDKDGPFAKLRKWLGVDDG